jgi:CheY-specific phosphatase CheX
VVDSAAEEFVANGIAQKIETNFNIDEKSLNTLAAVREEICSIHLELSEVKKELQGILKGQQQLDEKLEKVLATLGSSSPPPPLPTPPDAGTSGKKDSDGGDGNRLKMAEFLKQKGSVFDLRVLNAFIHAAKQTTRSLLMKEGRFIAPQPLIKGRTVTFAHCARMKLSKGNDTGFMGVAFKSGHLNSTVTTIFGIQENEITGAIIDDLTKEFCNQVFGYAKAILVKEGIEFTITTPEVASGNQLETRQRWGDPYLALVFSLEERDFFILFW